jgi:hypothetical protein
MLLPYFSYFLGQDAQSDRRGLDITNTSGLTIEEKQTPRTMTGKRKQINIFFTITCNSFFLFGIHTMSMICGPNQRPGG